MVASTMDFDTIKRLSVPNDNKVVLFIFDGLGGLPSGPGNKTELEAAGTPNLDRMAREGICGLHQAIGPAAIEARVRALAGAVKERLRDRIPGVRFFTPWEEVSSAGVVVFELPGKDHDAIFDGVYRTHRLGCASMHGQFVGIRLSPHIYNTMDQVDLAVEAVAAHV